MSSTQAFRSLRQRDGGVTVRERRYHHRRKRHRDPACSSNNVIQVTGGQISGGNRQRKQLATTEFTWSGGNINGAIGLGAGNDAATLRNITDAQLATVPVIDSGAGTDHLVFDNSALTGFGRFINWENVALTNGTRLTLDGAGMTLGDAGTGTGAVAIDASSTLFAGNGANRQFSRSLRGNW